MEQEAVVERGGANSCAQAEPARVDRTSKSTQADIALAQESASLLLFDVTSVCNAEIELNN